MSDPNDNKPADLEDLDLSWDDALADLEKELDEGRVTAESAPMPQKAAPPKAPARALYRPPSADELERMRRPDARETAPPPAAASRPSTPGLGTVGFEDDDEQDARTMVGVLSAHLRDGLSRSEPPSAAPRAPARPPSTRPPPAPATPESPARNSADSPARNSAVDLDFDGLLDGLDSDTSMYPAEVPRVLRASQPGAPPPQAPQASPSPPAVAPVIPEPSVPGVPRPVARPPLPAGPKAPPPVRPPLPRPNVPAPGRPLGSLGVPGPGVPGPGVPLGVPAALRAPVPGPSAIAKPPEPKPLGRGASALAAAIAAKAAAKEKTSPVLSPVVSPPAPAATAPAATAPIAPSVGAPAEPPIAPSEADEFDDMLSALDQDIAPISAPSQAETAFFREPAPVQRTPSIEEDLRDLEEPARVDAPAPPVEHAETVDGDDVELVEGESEEIVVEAEVQVQAQVEAEAEIQIEAKASSPSDDEPEISASDDDEPEISASESSDEGDLEGADVEGGDAEVEAAPAPSKVSAKVSDRGAIAARLSVRSRKPRKEHFPLVGRTPAHLAARAEFLETLAGKAKGAHASRLFVAAAELRRAIGGADAAAAEALLDRAVEAAPTDPTALRAARMRALAKGDRARLVALFSGEAKGTSRLALLAQLALYELGAADAGSMRHTDDRLGDGAQGVSVLLPLGSSPRKAGPDRERALVRAASNTTDPELVSALRLVAAASATHRNDRPALRALGDALGPEGVFVRARARAHDAESDPQSSSLRMALEEVGPSMGENGVALGEAARRLGAVSAMARGRFEEALEASRHAGTALSLRVRARAAARLTKADEEIEALTALAQRTGTTERAVSLARIAQLRLNAGELDLAEEALKAASLADPELAAPRVVRAQLSRLDPARAARTAAAPEPGAVLSAKAVYGTLAEERSALAIAEHEEDAPLAADVLGLDVAAGLNMSASQSVDPLLVGLRRHAERIPLESRKGALLALSIEARAAGRDEEAVAALEEARAANASDELLLAEVARFVPPSEAAVAWLEASATTSEARRASELALRGARILETYLPDGGGLETLAAARRAADADPTNDVAWLALSRTAKANGDAAALADAEEKLGELSSTDGEAAAHFIRAALARAGDDSAAAGALLRRARERAPRDLVLFALSMRLGEGLDDAERAAQLEAGLLDAPPALAPALALAAAATLEGMGSFADAARVLGDASGDNDVVGTGRARLRLLIAAGKTAEAKAILAPRARTGTTAERIEALESLAAIDSAGAGSTDAAHTAQKAILEVDPKHLPALRWLERSAMVSGREEELGSTEASFTASLDDPGDAMAHLRLAVRLATTRTGATGDNADAFLLANADRVRMDLWLARKLVAAARQVHDHVRAAAFERELVGRTNRPLEQASIALRAAESAERAGRDVAYRASILAEVAEPALEHPVLHTELAKALDLVGDSERSVLAWQRAGDASLVPASRAHAYHRAGVLAEDEVGDEERALSLYELAAEADVTYADVFGRAQRILERRGDVDRLNALLARRLEAGGDAAGLVELHLAQAKLREGAGDRDAARAALRAALELAPEHPQALKRLAELSLDAKDHRSAADALIRLARVRKDREELRWVFFQLGDIYDLHIPDPKRAEAAWKRVLKLAPDDLPSMERLAALYLREGPRESAIAQLDELIKVEPDPDRARDHQIALARALEEHGDARRAEQVLEAARRSAPTELITLKAMADLYTRQRAQPALAMHLNRAVSDFRHALATDLADTAAWLGLVEVLGWRRRTDAARVVASAGVAMGIVDVELGKLLDEGGGVPGVPVTLADESVEDAIAPAAVTGPLRAVFRALGSSLEKVNPFDPRTLRAEKIGPKDTAIRPIVLEVQRALGIEGEVEVWLAAGAPRACLPVQSSPPVLVVGKDLLAGTDEREKRFLVARALKIARAQLALAVRTPPAELGLLLAGLVLNADPNYQHGLDPAQAQEWARRVARTVPRRALEDNGPLLFEMAGAPEHDPARLPLAVAELGSRAALLATGSVPHGLSALAKMVVEAGLPADPSARAGVLARIPEAASLLAFAISDGHFEVRTRAGADRL